jgi:hypothetical protein
MKKCSFVCPDSIVTKLCLRLFFLMTWWCAAPAPGQFTLDREPVGPSTRKTGLVITEILYNPRLLPGLATNQTLEFIELHNTKPWPLDIGGFALRSTPQDEEDGICLYTFPTNTVLAGKAYVVVARVPELIRTEYGIENVMGPWTGADTNRLSRERGLIELLNRQGAILLAINYQDSPPWPEAADGPGHSLSLVRPSFGEDHYRAWAESDAVRGSPG